MKLNYESFHVRDLPVFLENMENQDKTNQEWFRVFTTEFKELITRETKKFDEEASFLFDFHQEYVKNDNYKQIMMETNLRFDASQGDYNEGLKTISESYMFFLIRNYDTDVCTYMDKNRVTIDMIDEIIQNDLSYAFCLLPDNVLTQEICDSAFDTGFYGASVSLNYMYIPDRFKTYEMAKWLIDHLDATDEFLLKYFPERHQYLKQK